MTPEFVLQALLPSAGLSPLILTAAAEYRSSPITGKSACICVRSSSRSSQRSPKGNKPLTICYVVRVHAQARFRKIAKQIHELKQVMRDDASTSFFSLTQAAQYVSGDFRAKVCVHLGARIGVPLHQELLSCRSRAPTRMRENAYLCSLHAWCDQLRSTTWA